MLCQTCHIVVLVNVFKQKTRTFDNLMQYLNIVSFITVMSNKLVFLKFTKKTILVAERKEKLKVYY